MLPLKEDSAAIHLPLILGNALLIAANRLLHIGVLHVVLNLLADILPAHGPLASLSLNHLLNELALQLLQRKSTASLLRLEVSSAQVVVELAIPGVGVEAVCTLLGLLGDLLLVAEVDDADVLLVGDPVRVEVDAEFIADAGAILVTIEHAGEAGGFGVNEVVDVLALSGIVVSAALAVRGGAHALDYALEVDV